MICSAVEIKAKEENNKLQRIIKIILFFTVQNIIQKALITNSS